MVNGASVFYHTLACVFPFLSFGDLLLVLLLFMGDFFRLSPSCTWLMVLKLNILINLCTKNNKLLGIVEARVES